jgi:hypothetical protein
VAKCNEDLFFSRKGKWMKARWMLGVLAVLGLLGAASTGLAQEE